MPCTYTEFAGLLVQGVQVVSIAGVHNTRVVPAAHVGVEHVEQVARFVALVKSVPEVQGVHVLSEVVVQAVQAVSIAGVHGTRVVPAAHVGVEHVEQVA